MGKQMKISEFEQLNSEQMNSSEVIEISQEEDCILKSKRNPLSRLGNWINNTFNFNTLQTYNKNLVDGINEKREIRVGYYGGPAHNSVYRGKWLGIAPTEEQLDAIENGSFDDLYIGDFWSDSSDPTSGEIRWRIAGFNYFQNIGLDNEVLRNHAVIIPDIPITTTKNREYGGTEFYENAGYKYDPIRGYKNIVETSNQLGKHKLADSIIHNLSHIPDHITNIYINGLFLYDNNDNFKGDVWCSVKVISYGEEPDNPGKGYVVFDNSPSSIKVLSEVGLNGQDDYRALIPPTQWGSKTFQYDANFYVMYTYHDDPPTGSLIEAQQIVFNKFGENHVMHHQSLLNSRELQNSIYFPNNIYTMSNLKEWTDVTVEIPTSAMIFGNSSYSCYDEYKINEYSFQLSFHHKPTYLSKAQHAPDQLRLPVNIGIKGGEWLKESGHIESYQLPLFLYDPALIHPGYAYWLRNCINDGWQQGGGDLYHTHHFRYCSIENYYSGYLVCYKDGGYNIGIRPYFCLAKYNTPK